ncbi:MAG: nucleoside hydrolase [Bacteroidales bacterium]|nr:nucleoside hydrolase [Bacteroidales bacterium]
MRKILLLVPAMCLMLASCGNNAVVEDKMSVIFETDVGNDVDDALAMDMLYKYAEQGRIEILGISINKNGTAPAEFADIMNTWYGHPDVPVAVVKDGAECESDAVNYASAVCSLENGDGTKLFARTLKDYSSLPSSPEWYRKVLAGRKDSSVTIVSVGFSTNLVRLLKSAPDEYSPLPGKELVARKVSRLVLMAGCFDKEGFAEYNVVKDIPAAKAIFEEWPTPVVTSPFEVGIKICYPATSIENDFGWAGRHPLVEAYKSYLPMPYDRPAWDLTALLYAVEGPEWFTVSGPGDITVDEKGCTHFSQSPAGTRKYLSVTPEQADRILSHFVGMISAAPEKYQENEKK